MLTRPRGPVPRAAEASLYTGEDKGRLCTLVCAQLVCAQHADAVLGAESQHLTRDGTCFRGNFRSGLTVVRGRRCTLMGSIPPVNLVLQRRFPYIVGNGLRRSYCNEHVKGLLVGAGSNWQECPTPYPNNPRVKTLMGTWSDWSGTDLRRVRRLNGNRRLNTQLTTRLGGGDRPVHVDHHDHETIEVHPDAVDPVFVYIEQNSPPEGSTCYLQRIRCANTTADEVRVKRRRLSDSPSDASKLKDGIPFGPHPRCMITGCVSAEVEACYILHPDTPQPLVYTYHVIVEDEQPPDLGAPQDHTIIPLATTADCSYRSLGWHELSANLHLMTIRVGREFIKRPLHPEHALSKDVLVHIPIIRIAQPDAVEPVSPHIERELPVEGISRLPKRKRSPETDIDEVPAKGVLYPPSRHAPAIFRRDLRELWETDRLLVILHPDHLMGEIYRTVFKYGVIAEDEHPPGSCATMSHPITPSIMTAPCSYRLLGWHELNADRRLMMLRAGRKLSKRPLHYQHILRDLLPYKENNFAYTTIRWHGSWTRTFPFERVPGRRLWATGELAPFPDGYFRKFRRQYCSPLSDDDAVRFPRPFRPILSGMKRKCSGDTIVSSQAYTADENAQREVTNIQNGLLGNLVDPSSRIEVLSSRCLADPNGLILTPLIRAALGISAASQSVLPAAPMTCAVLARRHTASSSRRYIPLCMLEEDGLRYITSANCQQQQDIRPERGRFGPYVDQPLGISRRVVLREWYQHNSARQLSRTVALHSYTRV
ncbi:predicted protein [Postia placenta Mad-698-R]|uniref:Uncharacterized protein n=1 Tax=Postia placenta MAD-698-R-SB12 TaxID=670580 RepID=A0A1X6N4W2_9APHY|nr:hypothetical protein POSPLADRAFT_1140346 [Postia placenta MAD-698-R-SB12]EED84981.1 predicted protein [Postia placenta Mad-698-R]OSX63657.1 hypothetical protein POSPLADRAFT_1140346 [Postia placenta MAD-698-R-SB12]